MPLTAEQMITAATAEGADPAAIQALIDGALKEHEVTVTTGLNAKNKELLGKLDAYKPFRDLDKTPEEILSLEKEAADLRAKLEAAEAGVDPAAVKALADKRAAEMNEQYRLSQEKIREADKTRADTAEATLAEKQTELLNERIRRRMRLHSRGIVDGLEEDVFNRLRPCFAEDEESGALVLRDPKTKTNLVGAKGEMTVDELFDGLATSAGDQSYNSKGAGYFASSGGGGGDHKTNKLRGSVGKERSKMTVAEKSAFIADHGQEAFRKLPA